MFKPNFNESTQYPAFIIKEDKEPIPLIKEKPTKLIVFHLDKF